MKKNWFFVLMVYFFGMGMLNAQESVEVDRKAPSTVGVDLLGGAMFFSEQSDVATVVGANFWTTVNCRRDNPNRPKWCVLFEMPVWWRRVIRDPWKNMPPISRWPPVPNPPGPDPWENFPLSEVELGRTLIVSPALGLRFGTGNLSFHIFGGGGFQHTQANSTEIRGLTYHTTDATAPLITYGAAARYNLTDGISARVEFRSLKTFEGNMNVIGPDGSVALFEGMAMNTPMISAGIGVGLR